MRLSIIIVTFDSRPCIDSCLASLLTRQPSGGAEIVVVDNGSTDGTAAHVRAAFPDVRLIESDNAGFAAGCNRGIRVTTSELILLINPDATVGPGTLDALITRLDARPDVAVIGPRIVDPDGIAELSFGSMLTPQAECRQLLLIRGRGLPLIAGYVEHLTRAEREVDWVSGACLLVRRPDAEAAGLLDERYFLYKEDVDFCAAIRAHGRLVLFSPICEVVHHRGRSAAARPATAAAAYHRSHLAFYEKHRPNWAATLRLWQRLTGRRA